MDGGIDMLNIAGSTMDIVALSSLYPPGSIEGKILQILSGSPEIYTYASMDQLKFELDYRRAIIIASRELNRSRLSFSTFRNSRCNPVYWERTDEGGFLLKAGAIPVRAIVDIYANSFLYATECATAIVIVYYKALADILPAASFNELFPRPYLMNWMHVDNYLGVNTYRNQAEYLPADCRYFRNPDVDPLTPEWQGENAIDLGNGTYYGHGIGITTADGIITALNRHRFIGSEVSAFLVDAATRPDFKSLWRQLSSVSSPVDISYEQQYS